MAQDTVELACADVGAGKPLVLLHGFPLDRSIWRHVTGLLQDHARVILPDLRGYGQSPVTDGVYTMRLLADDLAVLLDRLHLDRVTLAGHSMGGYVALAFAKSYPDRLSGLALVTTQAAADLPERAEGRLKLAAEVEKRGSVAVVEASLARYSPDAAVLEETRQVMLRADPRAVAGSLRGMAQRPDMTGFLPEVKVPSLVVAGAADELIPPQRSEEMAGLLPQGKLVMIAGGGHMVMLESPQVTAEALKDLIERV